jgi:hypothetical protein
VLNAFSITEVIIGSSILLVLAGLAASYGVDSLERSRIDAIAMDMAGWLNNIHANTTASSNFGVACTVTFTGDAVYPNANQFSAGRSVYTVSNGSGVVGDQSKDCSPLGIDFKIPANARGAYLIASPATIVFNLRGNSLVGDATNASLNNMSGFHSNRDIKIFHSPTRRLRCIRINYLLGLTSIGGMADATGVADNCPSTTFGAFANEKF